MARLSIIVAPDPRLKRISAPVVSVDEDVRALMDDLLETMYQAPGVGLAAPQVGVLKRVIVVDVGREDEERLAFQMANPELLWNSDQKITFEEGCLSLPDHYGDVTRPEAIKLRYRDRDDQVRELEAEGMLATCLLHEMEHLDGVLFVDHLSALKRNMILRKLTKMKKAGSEPESAAAE